MSSIYHIFVINRAGSLIFDYENREAEGAQRRSEKTFSWPMGIVLELIDQKPTVVFGEADGIRLRYWVEAVNGKTLKNENGVEQNFMSFIEDEKNFPVHLSFSSPVLSANEKIILSSMFHSLYTIAGQLSPSSKSAGIETLETSQFRLQCFQTMTGVKFIVVASPFTDPKPVTALLRRIYEIYADYALKNPFYSIDMPIRADKFEAEIKCVIEQHEKKMTVFLQFLPLSYGYDVNINTMNNYMYEGERVFIEWFQIQMSVDLSNALGYVVFQDGNVVKAEGDIGNAERIASTVYKMLMVSSADSLTKTNDDFTTLTLSYPTYTLTVTRYEAKQFIVVKRPVDPRNADVLCKELQVSSP